jgi:CubicO group peptidase (beta-lactamase class C family)
MRKLTFIYALFCGSALGLFAINAVSAPAAPHGAESAASTALAPTSRSAAAAGLTSQALKRAVAGQVKDLPLDEARVLSHVILPPQIIGATSDLGRDEGPIELTPTQPKTFTALAGPHLDVGAFGQALHNALKDQVTGYVMRLRKNGQTIYTLQWNWSKTPPDGGTGWNPQRQMHVASVSKLITAIAMTRLLNAKGVSYDAKIIDYLPGYWPKGPNIDKITFRHLLTHTSGFTGGTDFSSMKAAVAAGVSTNSNMADYIGHYRYRNMNFGLCRILLAVMNGNIAKSATFIFPPPIFDLSDQLWDAITISAYNQYAQDKVFAPAGVTNATLNHPAAGALAYQFPVTTNGWNSGDLGSVSGGAGWHVSVDQLLDVMGTFRRKGTIVSSATAQTMLDSGFGIDVIANTPAGKLYNKNGLWHDANVNGRTEQSLAYFLPEGMELVVLANSPIGNPEKFFRTIVTQTYVDNVK